MVVSRIDTYMVTGENTRKKQSGKQFKNNAENIYTSSFIHLFLTDNPIIYYNETITNFGFIFFHGCNNILLYTKLFLFLFVYSNDYIRYYESCTRKETRQW